MAFNMLFVCTGNTCRSPMAEGLMKSLLPKGKSKDFHISSAGIAAYDGLGASGNSVEVMRELCIDISGHRARQLTGQIVESADLILALSKSHKSYIKEHFPEALNKTYLLSEYADKEGPAAGIADPIGADKTTYRNCRDEIQKYVLMITEKIKQG